MSQTENEGETTIADAPTATNISDETSADASTATDEPELSFTDTVLKALEPSEESPASKSEPGSEAADAAEEAPDGDQKPDEKAEADSEEDDEFKLSPDEEKELKDKTRRRMDYLLTQRSELRTQLEAKDQEIQALKPEAESYRKVTDFMRENNLTAQDAGGALRLAGLIQSDPAAAFEELRPIMVELAQKTGALLPQDLQEDVRLGKITQQRAQELARARAQQTLAEGRAKQTETQSRERAQQEQAERERQQQANHLRAMATAGDELAAARAQSDPDWKSKEPLVVDKLKLDIAENGVPKDRADLEKRFTKIVTDVTAYLAGVGGAKPKPTEKPTASASSPGSDSRAAPASAHEAVLRALGE